MATSLPPSSSSAWSAKPGCPDHLRLPLERAVNALPIEFLEDPADGEVFSSLEECERRLIGLSLAQGFDIVKTTSATKPTPGATFCCVFHGIETRNWRNLEATIEKNEDGKITS